MSGRKIIVTGGSRGIGEQCVRKFSAMGDRVAFVYKNNDDRATAVSRESGAIMIKADLGEPGAAKNAMNEALDRLGGADVLVNNAGVSHIGLFGDLTETEYRKIMSTNLDAAVFCSQAVLGEMIHNKSGSIINISSMWGQTGASCEVVYSASKAALIGFTKALAKELGPSGITVNCVSPGVIATDMNSMLGSDVLKELEDETPLCRIGDPEEVADAVVYLASREASFITGQVLAVNGGIIM